MEQSSLEVDFRRPEKYHWVVFKYFGIVPPKIPGYKRNLYIFCSIIIHALFTVGCPVSMFIFLFKVDTFQEFSENAFVVIITAGEGVKFLSILFVIPKLRFVTETAERLVERMKSNDEKKCLNEAMKEGYKMSIRIIMAFIIGTTITQISAHIVIYASPEPILPFAGWYPIDWQNDRKKLILCQYHQFLSLAFLALQGGIANTYVLVYMQYFIGHVNALCVRIKKIGKNGTDDILELIECIKDYQHIIRHVV